jgi:hypothetical protein
MPALRRLGLADQVYFLGFPAYGDVGGAYCVVGLFVARRRPYGGNEDLAVKEEHDEPHA